MSTFTVGSVEDIEKPACTDPDAILPLGKARFYIFSNPVGIIIVVTGMKHCGVFGLKESKKPNGGTVKVFEVRAETRGWSMRSNSPVAPGNRFKEQEAIVLI